MAAPHASAVAALLVERLGRNPQAIRSALQQTADDINTPGTDPYSGKGRVNAARAAGL
jgi:subtilisin family serine protease